MARRTVDVCAVAPPTELPAPPGVVIDVLSPLVTPERHARIESVVVGRTDDVVVVLEEVHDPHNASAVLRSADAFGVQTIHVVDPGKTFAVARKIAQGTHRWIDVYRYDDVATCAHALKRQRYKIVVAAMGGDLKPEDLGGMDRFAIVLGNEHDGVSSSMRALADATYEIPMRGFVESLNVSVAAAITLRAATAGRAGSLSPDRRVELTARFLMASVKDAERIVRDRAVGAKSL